MSHEQTTAIIHRAVEAAIAKKSSGEVPLPHTWKCENEHRIDRCEERITEHGDRISAAEDKLNDGQSRFIRLESKLESVSEKLGELSDSIRSATRWVLTTVGGVAVGAIVWALVQSQKGAN